MPLYLIDPSDYKKLCNLLEDYCIRSLNLEPTTSCILLDALDKDHMPMMHHDAECRRYTLCINQEILSSIENEEIKQSINYVIEHSGSNTINAQFILFLTSLYYKSSPNVESKNKFKVYRDVIYKQLNELDKKYTTIDYDEITTIKDYMIDLFSFMLYMKDPNLAMQAQECELVKSRKLTQHSEYFNHIVHECYGYTNAHEMISNNMTLQKYTYTSYPCVIMQIIMFNAMHLDYHVKTDRVAVFSNYKKFFSQNFINFTKIKKYSLHSSYIGFAINAQALRFFKNETFDKLMDLLSYFMNHSSEEDYVKTIFHKISCFRKEDFEHLPE
ncbi:hypothetical protein AB837_00619 [bacterium AB1]|nr:hypothetical protein AB837_00619 [bacterium AB1]